MTSRRRVPFVAVAVVVGLVGLAVSLLGIAGPVPWRDEGATWMANQRSLSALWAMLGHLDAVHGTYYLGMRVWQYVFGSSILSLRLVSALAVGVAAGLVTLLGARLGGSRRVGVYAGLVFAVLPQVTWAGAEARSFAVSMAFVVAAMLAFWKAVDDGRLRWWGLYAGLAAVSVYLFMYTALAFLAVPLALLWQSRAQQVRGVVASVVAAGLAAPLVAVAVDQSDQVNWLERYTVRPVQVLQGAWWGFTPTSFLGSALLIAALANAVWLCRSARFRPVVASLVGWLVLPSAVLLLLSLSEPTYAERYVTAGAPALAILLALLVEELRGWWLKLLAGALVLAVAVPALWASRQPEAHMTASAAAVKLAELTEPGDRVYLIRQDRHVLWWAFPDQMKGLVNLGEQPNSRWKRSSLKAPSLGVNKLGDRLQRLDHFWIWADKNNLRSAVVDFGRFGFVEAERIKVAQSYKEGYPVTLVLMRRATTP